MHIQQYWGEIKAAIDEELRRQVQLTQNIPGRYLPAIEQSIEGGKRLRGMMTCLVCDALGGRRSEAMLRAVPIECIHAATLVHDDIIDGDTTRRGKPAIWTLEGVGKEGAILIGDFLWARGMHMLCLLEHEEAEFASSTMVKVTSGILQELEIVKISDVPLQNSGGSLPFEFSHPFYERIIRLKTGELFGLAARLGAMAAGARNLAGVGHSYGRACGNVFQIADDLVDVLKQEGGEEFSALHKAALLSKMTGEICFVTDCLKDFPDNEYKTMLKQLPGFITDLMLKEASV